MGLEISGHDGGGRYLLVDESVPPGDPPPADTDARILDATAGVLYPPKPFHSITAHNPYFREYDAESGELDALLADVEVRGPPKTEVGDASEHGF